MEWPEDERTVKTVIPASEAGAALAAAAAIRELVKTNKDPGLFWGCSSPEQGLDVAVFTGPTAGLYYVVLEQRFHRCGGPSARVLDWNYLYAVTPQGEVVLKAPPPSSVEYAPAPSATQPPPAEPPSAAPSEAVSPAPETIHWPEHLSPLAALDGSAIEAAQAVLKHVLTQKEYPGPCEASAKDMKMTIGQEDGLYFVRVEHQVNGCGPSTAPREGETDWSKVYAVLPDGRLVAPNIRPP